MTYEEKIKAIKTHKGKYDIGSVSTQTKLKSQAEILKECALIAKKADYDIQMLTAATKEAQKKIEDLESSIECYESEKLDFDIEYYNRC